MKTLRYAFASLPIKRPTDRRVGGRCSVSAVGSAATERGPPMPGSWPLQAGTRRSDLAPGTSVWNVPGVQIRSAGVPGGVIPNLCSNVPSGRPSRRPLKRRGLLRRAVLVSLLE